MSVSILAVNVGSSSIKLGGFRLSAHCAALQERWQAEAGGLGSRTPYLRLASHTGTRAVQQCALPRGLAPTALLEEICDTLSQGGQWLPPQYVVHRVVHGGDITESPLQVDAPLRARLESLARFAPLHQPVALSALDWMMQRCVDARHFVCLDTAFHSGGRGVHDRYAIPRVFGEAGIRRYGFHGIAIEDALWRLQGAGYPTNGRVVVAHLGSGVSVSAVAARRSMASTMGTTPLDGVVMGTRCGQLDPGAVLAMLEMGEIPGQSLSIARATEILYRESGLLALSGKSPDLRELIEDTDAVAQEAIDYFESEVVKAIGAMVAVLDGIDTLIFTGGIGVHQHALRSRILTRLAWLGVKSSSTTRHIFATEGSVSRLSEAGSPVMAVVVVIDEQQAMARKLTDFLKTSNAD